MDGNAVAGLMCTAVFEGDLVKLRRLLRSGAPPNAADYDKRCALHIAGAEGSLTAVKLLVEEGGADPLFQVRCHDGHQWQVQASAGSFMPIPAARCRPHICPQAGTLIPHGAPQRPLPPCLLHKPCPHVPAVAPTR